MATTAIREKTTIDLEYQRVRYAVATVIIALPRLENERHPLTETHVHPAKTGDGQEVHHTQAEEGGLTEEDQDHHLPEPIHHEGIPGQDLHQELHDDTRDRLYELVPHCPPAETLLLFTVAHAHLRYQSVASLREKE